MAKTFTYTTLALSAHEEDDGIEVEVTFTVAWGSPESGRFGPPEDYDPGCGDEVENITVIKVGGLTEGYGKAFAMGYQSDAQIAADIVEELQSDRHQEAMIELAIDEAAADHERGLEYAAEERRDAARYYGEA